MNYKKRAAAKIFTGKELKEGMVLIADDNGTVVDMMPQEAAGDDVEFFQGILSPGLINCHCHLELSHMKGRIPEKTGLVDFVFKVVTERHHTEEEIIKAIIEAEDEMLANGIVAVGDICNNDLTLQQKQKHRLAYYNFIEASGWLPSIAQARFERAKKIYDEFEGENPKLQETRNKENHRKEETSGRQNIKLEWGDSQFQIPNSKFEMAIVPHAPYSVSLNLWKQIQPFYQNKTVSIHNQETSFEDQFFFEGKGDFVRMYELMKIDNTHHRPTKRSSLQSYYDQLTWAKNIILVHNTFTKESDVQFVNAMNRQRGKTFFCLCVNANQYIEDSLPDVEMFRKNKCSLVLGTDSLASNWSLSIMDEIKTLRKSFPTIPLEEMLTWATSNGAEALGFDSELGSFEKGKTPGIVLINEAELSAKRIA
jgi:aminodeoxyfutalosine deaminase